MPSLFPDDFVKEDLFRSVFTDLVAKNKAEFDHYGTRHVIFSYKELGQDVFIWQLARVQQYEKPMAGEEKIEKVADIRYPFIHVIFHVSRQLALVEYNSAVFNDMESVKNKLEKYLNQHVYPARVSVNLHEVTDNREFWTKVAEMDVIQDVTLEFAPPNLWGGEKEVDRLIKDAHEQTNFDKFKLVFQNKIQGLIFNAKTFGEQIYRLGKGGGEYIISGLKDGLPYVLKSIAKPFKKNIEDVNRLSEDEAEDTFRQIDEMNDNEPQQ